MVWMRAPNDYVTKPFKFPYCCAYSRRSQPNNRRGDFSALRVPIRSSPPAKIYDTRGRQENRFPKKETKSSIPHTLAVWPRDTLSESGYNAVHDALRWKRNLPSAPKDQPDPQCAILLRNQVDQIVLNFGNQAVSVYSFERRFHDPSIGLNPSLYRKLIHSLPGPSGLCGRLFCLTLKGL